MRANRARSSKTLGNQDEEGPETGVADVERLVREAKRKDTDTDTTIRIRTGCRELFISPYRRRLVTALGTNQDFPRYFSCYPLPQEIDSQIPTYPKAGPGTVTIASGGFATDHPACHVVSADESVAVARELATPGGLDVLSDHWINYRDAECG